MSKDEKTGYKELSDTDRRRFDIERKQMNLQFQSPNMAVTLQEDIGT